MTRAARRPAISTRWWSADGEQRAEGDWPRRARWAIVRPPMDAAELLCPPCGAPYEQGDFLCTNCELILDLDAAEANYKPTQPSIARALLPPPQRRTGMRPAIPAELKKKG